ncbi:MAG: GNAT family N-acetyltransferase [Flavobacteriaceae bacterium]|nr:GNAT family N-acetyltransferase [Flavobacteriaceae bacterium]
MSNIILKEVTTTKDLKAFVEFPNKLYKNNPYYIPSLVKDEMYVLDKTKNPVFEHADARYFLAYKHQKVVGRVAAIINRIEIDEQGLKKMRFGWLDMIDDLEVTKKLLDKVFEIGRENQLEFVEGPVGFSNMEKAGMLCFGFDQVGTMITWYNHPYYPKHLEELGFTKLKEWVEFKLTIPDKSPEKPVKFADIVKKRYGLKELKFSKRSEIIPYVDKMFDLLSKTYNKLPTFVPIQPKQIAMYKKKYLPFIQPKYIQCVVNQSDELIAFAIVMPSFSKALQKAKGKLLPFGWYHLWRAQKVNDKAAFYLIGIAPEYQGKGVTSIIFHEVYKLFQREGINKAETNPELEDNVAVQALWKFYDPILHKRRRTYTKNIEY